MDPNFHPRFEGFFVKNIQNGKDGDFACILTRHGKVLGRVWTERGSAVFMSLAAEDETALRELALRLDPLDQETGMLMLELLEAAELDPLSTRYQIVRTAPDPAHPLALRTQQQLPLTLTLDDLTQLARHPHFSPGLTDYYVRHRGWQPLPLTPVAS